MKTPSLAGVANWRESSTDAFYFYIDKNRCLSRFLCECAGTTADVGETKANNSGESPQFVLCQLLRY
jgi:hypothetical protein